MTPRQVGIFIFDGVEVLDFCGPFEVFSVAAKRNGEHEEPLFTVATIAESINLVTCTGGLLVQPQYAIGSQPALDLLVIPGGAGTRPIYRDNRRVLDWIGEQADKVEVLASVCTGALLLAKAGLLHELPATTHWGSIDWLRHDHPDVLTRERTRFVDTGRIVTSAGISAGIDMALHLVERFCGRYTAEETARYMEYHWQRKP
jgi:transcriptional regulator GlxA family with amidase domain